MSAPETADSVTQNTDPGVLCQSDGEFLPPRSVRVVTVAYNPGAELERFLDSLRLAADPQRVRIHTVIADNGQEHALVDELAQRYGATVLRDGVNRGYGGGANQGARGLEEDWILIANPDLVWTPGSLEALMDVSVAHPEAGCLGPRLLNTDGTVYPSGRALPSLVKGAGHAVLGRVWPGNPFSASYHGDNADGVHAVGWLSGACLLLPSHVWKELGGFDEDYFMFFEDVDLGKRVGEAGYLNLQVSNAVVIHEQGASWKKRPEKMIRAHHASARLYLGRTYGAPWQAPLRWGLNTALRVREELTVRAGN